jgi:ATP-dependent helicase HepA
MRTGQFVRIHEGGRGVAKLVAVSGGTATLEYFDSAAVRVRDEVPETLVRPARIRPQTRCYLYDERRDVWQAGRVGIYVDGEYEVNLPDRTSRYVREAELYVRWAHPIRDPMEVLVSRAHETPFFHEHRLPFVRALIRQRAAARGLTGLLSSRILLYPHQVEVARRILEDPVQRYLLADEVGLGKTVEAGIVIRQFLLDHRTGRVLVLVPAHLREQWRSELESKFNVPEDRVLLLGTDEWEREPAHDAVQMVVIDEAHHVADLVRSGDPAARARFELYRALAWAVPRLLLLSATPALNNEAAFLALLHLLEPEVYRVEDVDLLRARLAARQEVGRFLVSFNETSPAFSLRRGLGRLPDLVPNDAHLHELAARLRGVLDAEPADPEARTRLVREIRSHIGDQYRLHRRLLRTRRQSVGEEVTAARLGPDAGPGHLVEEYDLGSTSANQHELLDEWREAAVVAFSDAGTAEEIGAAAQLPVALLALLDAAAAGGTVLAAAVDCRLGDGAGPADDLGLLAVRALREAPRLEGEGGLLRRLRETAADDERGELLVAMLKPFAPRRGTRNPAPQQKVLVFTSFPSVRSAIAERLRVAFGDAAVASYGAGDGAMEVDAEVARCRDAAECWLLVCDRSGEEGRNLQWIDCLIHLDLPFSPNRVEQRIGRLDRIGRGRAVRSRVFLGPETDDSLYAAWFRVLDEGFGVFRSSIAGLQFFIDTALEKLVLALFRGGARGLVEAIPAVREGIAQEQGRLAEQHALDEIDVLDRGGEEYFRDLVAQEAEWERFRADFEGWLCGCLNVEPHRPAPGAVRYQPTERSLIPHDFLLHRLGAHMGRAGTFQREASAAGRELALYRPGEPLVDTLEEYIHWDDRGRAFAVWRCDPRLDATPGAEWTGFRLDYVVEADIEPARRVLAEVPRHTGNPAALRRRADAHLPPGVETIFVGADGVEVTDATLLQILARPYRKREKGGLDYSLTKEKLPALGEVVDVSLWPGVCREARAAADRTVLERPELRARWAAAATLAEAALGERVARLRRRTASAVGTAGERAALAAETEVEERLAAALAAGVREPRLRLDAVGFFVLSGRDPFR